MRPPPPTPPPLRTPAKRASPPRPLLVLPGAGPGGRTLRLRLRPGRVAALLAILAVLAMGAGAALAWVSAGDSAALADENRGLRAALAALNDRLGRWEGGASAPRGPVGPDAGVAPGGVPPRIRVAVARDGSALAVAAPGLSYGGTAIGGGEVVVERRGDALALRGGGPLAAGTPFASASGPVRVAGQAAPGDVAFHPTADGGLVAVAEVEIERYVAGVLAAEIPRGWEAAALGAQAVAARTYALWRRAGAPGPFDVEGTTADQVFSGEEPEAWATAAAAATRGMVLVDRGRPAAAYFHAACGGRTEDARAVWPDREAPSFPPVLCGRCARSPFASWTVTVDAGELGAALAPAGLGPGPTTGLRVAGETATGRVAEVVATAGGREARIPGNELRRLLGYGRLRSTSFAVRADGPAFTFSGTGAGHGVGLCQWGARGFAREGLEWQRILAVYYPGLELRRAY